MAAWHCVNSFSALKLFDATHFCTHFCTHFSQMFAWHIWYVCKLMGSDTDAERQSASPESLNKEIKKHKDRKKLRSRQRDKWGRTGISPLRTHPEVVEDAIHHMSWMKNSTLTTNIKCYQPMSRVFSLWLLQVDTQYSCKVGGFCISGMSNSFSFRQC